jgi:hypothetical protein
MSLHWKQIRTSAVPCIVSIAKNTRAMFLATTDFNSAKKVLAAMDLTVALAFEAAV